MKIFILLIVCFVGYLIGESTLKDRIIDYQQKAVSSEIKASRIEMVIRSYRNQLYRRETELKATATSSKQDSKELENVQSQLKIVRQIEEDVQNEMQKI